MSEFCCALFILYDLDYFNSHVNCESTDILEAFENFI